jgi:thiol-disulfide isomerase/thioredoxin
MMSLARPAVAFALLAGLSAAAAPAVDTLVAVDEAAYRKVVASRKGKIVLVDFWATYCVPCRKEMPDLVKLAARYKAAGVDLVTVSADEPEQEAAAKAFLSKAGVTSPVYIRRTRDDDKFINSVDPKWSGALPALFIYDRAGRKAQSFVGESSLADIEKAIRKLLK